MKCKEARRSGNVNRVTAYKEQSLVVHCGNDHACVNFIKQEAVFVMATIQSYLSSPQSGYDFVLSTTQASINSNLLQYLDEEDQPEPYICFLADPETSNPSE